MNQQPRFTGKERIVRKDNREHRTTWVKHHRKRNFLIFGLVLALLVIIIVGLSNTPQPAARVGQQAPDFTLQDITNANFHLLDRKGTPILIEFMTTSCHFCTQQAPILSNLYSQHRGQVLFVSISIDPFTDQPGVLLSYSQANIMPWTWTRDVIGLKTTYGVNGTPTMFLLDKNCVIQYRFDGVTDLQTLNNGVQSLL